MKIVIVDDEPLGRLAVRQLLRAIPDAEVVAESGEGDGAVQAIVQHNPDILFLDVQMPGLSGFDVLERVGTDAVPALVFVTAHDRYALRAFEAHAVDYLLKPIDPDRFRDAYARAARAADREWRERAAARLDSLMSHLAAEPREGPGSLPDRLVVKEDGRLCFVRVAAIDWVEAAGNYVKLHAAGREYTVRQTLERMEERLGPERFVRIRRSVLVHSEAITALESYGRGSYTVILRDGRRLISSRYAGQRLRELVARYDTGR